VFPQIIKFDADSTEEITHWSAPKGDDFPSLGLFVDFNIQVTSFLENATSHI